MFPAVGCYVVRDWSENRYPFFRIMRDGSKSRGMLMADAPAVKPRVEGNRRLECACFVLPRGEDDCSDSRLS